MDGLGQRAHETGDLPDESGIFPVLVHAPDDRTADDHGISTESNLGGLFRGGNAETLGDWQVRVLFEFEE